MFPYINKNYEFIKNNSQQFMECESKDELFGYKYVILINDNDCKYCCDNYLYYFKYHTNDYNLIFSKCRYNFACGICYIEILNDSENVSVYIPRGIMDVHATSLEHFDINEYNRYSFDIEMYGISDYEYALIKNKDFMSKFGKPIYNLHVKDYMLYMKNNIFYYNKIKNLYIHGKDLSKLAIFGYDKDHISDIKYMYYINNEWVEVKPTNIQKYVLHEFKPV